MLSMIKSGCHRQLTDVQRINKIKLKEQGYLYSYLLVPTQLVFIFDLREQSCPHQPYTSWI